MTHSASSETYAASLDSIRAAAARIAGAIHRTPVLTCTAIDDLIGARVFFKAEHLQRGGAFKMRGASNAVLSLDEAAAARGVVTHSSGNFAQAMARAARTRGIDAYVVMPENAPQIKQRAVAGYGGQITLCPPTLADRESHAEAIRARTGATFLHPYDQPDIIAGQGTCAIEFLDEVPDLDVMIAPVGGGGLMSGICIAGRALRPEMRLFAAEPEGADDARRSFVAGERIPQTGPDTIADGLLTSLGTHTWPILRDHLEDIITVDDDATVEAMRLVWERMKQVIEPSAAVTLAAVISARERLVRGPATSIGIVLSGGNVDLTRALDLLGRG